MRLECSFQQGSVTLEDVMETLKSIQEDQRKTVADFNKSYEVLYERIEESTSKLQVTMEKIEGYVKEVDSLKSDNVALKMKVLSLESRLEDMENYSRRNCIEIQGVPEERDEDVLDVIKKVGNALDTNITEDMVDACHRLGRRTDEKKPRGIIVKFVRRMDKEQLMKKRQQRKRDFSTRHLGLPSDTPVYLNDSLSPARRRLLGLVRQKRKDNGFKYLWLRNGSILLRKEEGAPVVEIRNQADLDRL